MPNYTIESVDLETNVEGVAHPTHPHSNSKKYNSSMEVWI